MKKRYQVGFPNGASCFWLAYNVGREAIVDTKSLFGYGECIAIADNKEIAEKIVNALNLYDTIRVKSQND